MISDLLCLTCHHPAVIVLSSRIDQGTVHYPTCPTHLDDMVLRLASDAYRALDNLQHRPDLHIIDTELTVLPVPADRSPEQ